MALPVIIRIYKYLAKKTRPCSFVVVASYSFLTVVSYKKLNFKNKK